MSDISKIDKNFIVDTKIERPNMKILNIEDDLFRIYGVTKESGKYRRMPEAVAKSVSEGVYSLHTHTTGGRVRFLTDSEYVMLSVKTGNVGRMPHFTIAGSAGADIYADNVYCGTFIPPFDFVDKYEGVLDFPSKKLREITINMPTYTEVVDMYIGINADSVVLPDYGYEILKPIVYYGSSITQGGCVTRPGMTYQNILSRHLNTDYINLGFSGSAKGEEQMAEYIASLDMSVFVLDYDHNAPSVEHLQNTHEKFFKVIREKNPDLPVIMMSRPKYILTEDEKKRKDIIERTYINAVIDGDKNVYFVDGRTLMGEDIMFEGTVDNCHPTDLGFFAMAKRIEPVIRDILNIK